MMGLHALVFVCFWIAKDTLSTGPAPAWSTPIAVLMTAAFVAFTLLLRAIPDAAATSHASGAGARTDATDAARA